MILDQIIGFFSSDMGIDLGTANTLVLVKDKGIIINEPSVVAVQREKYGKQKILAVGHEAKEMVGKTPGDIEAIPRIIISVPYGLTQVERKAVRESALSAGAREEFLIEEPMAAAIGANLPVREPQGNLVVDIGGGTTEIGVVSLGGLVISKSIRTAGDKIDISIVNYIKEKYNLLIGERAGEDIKISVGSAIQLPEELSIVVKGRDQISGLLSRVELTSEDVREAMREPLKEIADALKTVLEMMPPDLAGDIVENGIVLTGGGALIRGIDKYLSDIVKLPVFVADEPLLAVATGTGKALEEIKFLQQLVNEE